MTWKKKGNRIRASDKSLVYHFCIGWLLLLFVAVFLLLNLRQLLVIDWKDFNLLHAGITWTAYNSITVLIATGVCALVAFLYYRYGYDRIKRLLHRQKLARMVLENKWYEAENTKDSGFFTDLQSRSREKIVWFPKIYYQMDNGLLHILCEITMGKYQEQLLSLEDKLESGLYCELTDKTLHDGYIEYTLLYDMIANRISIDEVVAENGGLRLMKNLVWEYDSLPHALICGGTGGGKTYFLLTIIEALLRTNADLYILDPKNADLADLGTVMGNVYHTKDDMIDCVNAFYEDMVTRSEEMKLHPNYRTGENYAYLGLAPQFLIFDEYVAFLEILTTKESTALLSQLKKIVMLGRQAGYFLIVACQRPDAKYFGDGIRDNFNFRVGLTKELQDLNADTIRTDIPTSATVTNVLVWNVEQSGTDDFTVAYEVDQQVKEGEQTQAVTENYTVTVHVDKDGAMVITQNPTLAPAVQKSKYEPKVQEADVSVSSDTVKDATAFLETFFKLYPTTTEKELAYYVKDGVLAPVSGDYVFSELVNPVFTKDGDNLKVSVSVKYLDNKSKMTQISQYELVLHKDDNWKIIE